MQCNTLKKLSWFKWCTAKKTHTHQEFSREMKTHYIKNFNTKRCYRSLCHAHTKKIGSKILWGDMAKEFVEKGLKKPTNYKLCVKLSFKISICMYLFTQFKYTLQFRVYEEKKWTSISFFRLKCLHTQLPTSVQRASHQFNRKC